MLALPIYVQKSHLLPQFGNISGLKPMKTTTPSRRASFASKRFLLLEEILPTFIRHFRDHHPANAQKLGKQA
jgi:hypothetical protein